MKIKSISFFNIGPYEDLNKFDLTISKDKNIVLIGGKNGAGKTTFFKAIKTCLYGSKVWGFDAPGKEYFSIINGLINNKSLYDNAVKAYVEIELVFNDGKETNVYLLHREWKKVKQSFFEFFHVKKNDTLIMRQEEEDFINYLLSIIPPDMFNFYFFDGESIAEFFLGTDGNKNFRNAFLKLYGLDTLSIMVDNFTRNIKKADAKNSSYNAFLDARKNYEHEEKLLFNLKEEIIDLENKIDLCKIQIHSLQSNYSKDGGIGLSEWKDLNAQIIKEENNRDSINRWLKDVANNYLPFIILNKQLIKLQNELLEAQENQKSEIVINTFKSDTFGKELNAFLIENRIENLNSNALISFLQKSFGSSNQVLDFDFSINQINRIIAQIYEKKDFDKHAIISAISQLNSSLRKSKKLREQLSSSSIDGYEEFVEQKEHLEKRISSLSIILENTKHKLELQTFAFNEAQRALEKAKSFYEMTLKNKSISDISERAAATFSLVEEKLVLRQSKLLQEEFLNCFTSIINKNNFIDGIVIDKKINVVPYKYIKVTKQQLDNYKTINKDFLNLFDDTQLIIDINNLEFDKVNYINLPSPIKAPFSQGERQVYIMSIYLALLKTSHKDIPFFIDTPFARIDSEHRVNIVKEFFLQLDNQMFILSTDEEIVGEYKKMMSARISNKFMLQINNYGTTKIKTNMYFGENK